MFLDEVFRESELKPIIRIHSLVVYVVSSSQAVICYLLVLVVQKSLFVIASYIITETNASAMGLHVIGNADPFFNAILHPLYVVHPLPMFNLQSLCL